jgi:hypothetical protein
MSDLPASASENPLGRDANQLPPQRTGDVVDVDPSGIAAWVVVVLLTIVRAPIVGEHFFRGRRSWQDGWSQGRDQMHDLIIRGGTVVDGTGGPSRIADVAVDGEVIIADGWKATICSGEVTLEDGEHTDARPGRLIRCAQPPTLR